VAQAVQFAILGLGAGAAYTLLAQGIVLIYRGSGIVNFAHGAMAMFAAFFCFLTLVDDHGWPVGAAIPVAVLFAAVLGVAIQNGILRFMRGAAPLVRLVATLGVLIVLQGLAGQKLWDNEFHQVDQFLPTHNYTLHQWFGFDGELGRVVVQQDRLILLGIAIALTFALWAFTRFTRIGLAISASAENERAVAALGWSPNFLASVTWGIGGATAGLAGILLAPNAGLSLTVFTIVVTVSALAVALIGGFSSFPLTLIGGVALGIAESEVLTYSSDITDFLHDKLGIENGATGLQRALPFLVIVVVLVVRGKALPLRSHVLERLPDLGSGVVTRWFLVVVLGSLLLLNTFAFDAKWSTAVFTTLIVGVFILSIVVLTGYAGQLSLAQYAIGGLGALMASRLVGQEHWPAELAFLAGVVFAIVVGALFAIPALRTRGVNLAVVTLGLGFAVQQVVFANQYFTGDFGSVTTIGRIRVFGWDVSSADHPDRFLVVCLGVFVVAALMVTNLRRSGWGRRLIAVRNNERAAASLGISVFGAKLYAFSVAAAIAAFAGILLAFKDSTVVYGRYDPFESINTVGNAVAGGVGWVLGAVFGGNLAPGGVGSIPLDWINLGSWLVTIGGVTLILIVILNPNGIASVVLTDERGPIGKLRMRSRRTPAREHLVDVAPSAVEPATLELEDLTVRFGAVVAVDEVSFRVNPREVVGLIGPNGAGKTTIVDALTGFTRPTSGRVLLNGTAMTGRSWTPARRARAGVRRSFQSLELFEEISVAENLHAGAGVQSRLSGLRDLVWPARPVLPPTAVSSAREFGLEHDLDRLPGELPYGRRRLVGIARAMASAPSVLLLDEPAAGLDDIETAELGDLVRRFADSYGMAVLLIEHDVDLVLRVCDRIVVVDFGRKIAEGTPNEIRNDPAVIAAYLGEELPTPDASADAGAPDAALATEESR
jgi:sulfate-transporting ATPase